MTNSGFLLIDKPAGITSFGVIAQLRRLTGVRKIGHAGTLDPFATGLLIVGVGREATREINTYVKLDKAYEAEFCFGATTDTLDPEGEMVFDECFDAERLEKQHIDSVTKEFTGKISQVPPAFSAIKIGGKRAYALARAGKEVQMEARPITINHIAVHDIAIREVTGLKGKTSKVPVKKLTYANLTIDCGSGTYIRSLARDMAQALGTTGYVRRLRRTRIGDLSIEQAHTLENLSNIPDSWETYLIPSHTI